MPSLPKLLRDTSGYLMRLLIAGIPKPLRDTVGYLARLLRGHRRLPTVDSLAVCRRTTDVSCHVASAHTTQLWNPTVAV
jgi:hypothetical protein